MVRDSVEEVNSPLEGERLWADIYIEHQDVGINAVVHVDARDCLECALSVVSIEQKPQCLEVHYFVSPASIRNSCCQAINDGGKLDYSSGTIVASVQQIHQVSQGFYVNVKYAESRGVPLSQEWDRMCSVAQDVPGDVASAGDERILIEPLVILVDGTPRCI